MNWWRKLKKNPLAKLGAILLIFFYVIVIGADFIAPYDPYLAEENSSLLPPTTIYWRTQQKEFIGLHVYPTTQGKTDVNTGDRLLEIDYTKPSPIRLFVKGKPYQFLQIKLPLPPKFEEVEIFSGFKINRRLFGTTGEGKINLLGTDEQGRDQLSRLLYGGRISLFIGLIGILISFPLGMIIGGIAGYFGGWIDNILMRLVEVLMTIPGIYLLVALAAILPPSLSSSQRFLLIVLITSLIGWSGLARVIRGQVLTLKEQEFVESAKAIGANSIYIIIKHILPQTATYIIISATLSIPSFIVAESVLSLIGLGIQQPDPSWGNLLSLATNASILVLQPWLIFPPAILIILTVLSFNLLGDGLRDALDPKSINK
ncbi:MAG: ABC transporter permease [Cyanobacteria bacterium]|nr:ABC transporter permease [Cyanobacteria bacterium CG_2015-16_32_12]NCO77638.1 ABC transporter permease [Cyanobacteria bacterium CG_2015-22_32_23]NCQ04306.1 ABC transporter permease [Cyanobacteria bacterium CG_2015-09_32_10]NCQ42951.1 ABC transporter permease [Cyanobacteria bacterium CG_2015-04_32_10]NCS84539.1 ABC transporter permease [Cyanobacteria bacterium CG_2015-02_32_10]